VSYRPDAHLSKSSSVRTTWIPIRTFLCVEKHRTAPACIHLDDSAARRDDSQCSIKLQDFFPKHRYGKIAATVRTTWILARTRLSIRQVSQFKSRSPEREHQIWKLRASDQPSRRPSSWSRCAKPLYGNYLQWTCDCPDDRAPPSGRSSFQE